MAHVSTEVEKWTKEIEHEATELIPDNYARRHKGASKIGDRYYLPKTKSFVAMYPGSKIESYMFVIREYKDAT